MGHSRVLEKIIVYTGLAEKVGITRVGDRVKYDELFEKINRSEAEYIAIVPDINELLSDLILPKALNALKRADVVIVVAKPSGILSKLLRRIGSLDVLRKLTGHPRGYLIVFRRSIVGRLNKGDDVVSSILSNAMRIVEMHYDIPLIYFIVNIYSKLPYPLLLAIREPLRIIKYALVGLFGSLVNVSVVEITSMLLNISRSNLLLLAIPGLVGFEVSLTTNFILHELWTFKDMSLQRNLMSVLKRYIKYHFVSIASLASQITCIMILTGLMGVKIGLAAFVGIVLGFIANYILGRLYTWSTRR